MKTQMKAAWKTFRIRYGREAICEFLTEIGPDRIIAMESNRDYTDQEYVTVWYWKVNE